MWVLLVSRSYVLVLGNLTEKQCISVRAQQWIHCFQKYFLLESL